MLKHLKKILLRELDASAVVVDLLARVPQAPLATSSRTRDLAAPGLPQRSYGRFVALLLHGDYHPLPSNLQFGRTTLVAIKRRTLVLSARLTTVRDKLIVLNHTSWIVYL